MPGIELPSGIKTLNPVPVIYWSGPYTGANETAAKLAANTAIPSSVRFPTMEVNLIIAGGGIKYWYKDGITDVDLVPFLTSVSGVAGGELSGTYPNPTLLNSAVIGKLLTDYVSSTGTITSTDTILSAIQKLNGNTSALVTGVSSVFGRTGAITATTGDYNSSQITEDTNLYFTDSRARASISLTTTGTSGAATYNNTTGVLNIPEYQGGVTSFNGRTGVVIPTTGDYTKSDVGLSNVPNVDTTNASNIITGTLVDARLSSNVNLLDVSQTITANKLSTALTTLEANNLGTTQDVTKGILLQNNTAATSGVPVQISPAMVFSGQFWNTGASGSGVSNGNNNANWKIEQRPVTGNESTVNNNLVISQKMGSNGYNDIATFSKEGLVTNLFQNTLTLGQPGNAGTLILNRSSGGSIGSIVGDPAGLTINTGLLTLGSSSYIAFGTGSPSFGSRYSPNNGLYLDVDANASATPLSRLTVMGGASIGQNVAAPTNGLRVLGNAIFDADVTAANIIKSGGTSSQILAANGSVITAGTNVTISGGTISATGGSGVTSVTGTANRITSSGGTTPVIDISSSYVGQSSITTVGTLSSGAIPASLITAGTFGTGAYTMGTSLTTPVINGGTAANDDITIQGTTNATRTTSYVNLQPNGGLVGIGTMTPLDYMHVTFNEGTGGQTGFAVQNTNASGASGLLYYNNTGALSVFQGYINSTGELRFNNIAASATVNFLTNSASRLYLANSGNVGVGTATPNTSAKLDVTSTSQGFLPPRLTTTQRDAIVSPAAGLIIYNTTTNKHQGYNGTIWNDFY